MMNIGEFIGKACNIAGGVTQENFTEFGKLYNELMEQMGWHPASEKPEPYNQVVVYCSTDSEETSAHEAYVNRNGYWSVPNVRYWCERPE